MIRQARKLFSIPVQLCVTLPLYSGIVIVLGATSGFVVWVWWAIALLRRTPDMADQPFTPFTFWSSHVFEAMDRTLVLSLFCGAAIFLFAWGASSRCLSRWSGTDLIAFARKDAFTYLPCGFLWMYMTSDVLPRKTICWAIISIIALKALEFLWSFFRSDLLSRLPSKQVHIRLFLSAFVIYGFFNLGINFQGGSHVGPMGDEMVYLLMTESLLNDGDFRITNNYENGDYTAFSSVAFPIGHDNQGKPFSQLLPGLPVLIAPIYWISGYRGAIVMMSALAALLMLQLYILCTELTGHRHASFLTWVMLGFASPALLYSSQIFPETAGGLLIIYSVRKILKTEGHHGAHFLWTGLSISILPLLNVRFMSIQMLLIGLWIYIYIYKHHIYKHRSFYGMGVRFMLPSVISLVLLGWYQYIHYGSPLPYSGYTHVSGNEAYALHSFQAIAALLSRWRGVLGIIFDQEYGLLPYAPVYLLTVPGIIAAFRIYPTYAGCALGLFLVSLIQGGLTPAWSGAYAPPARFLVSVAPLLGIFLVFSLLKSHIIPLARYVIFF